MCRNLSRILAVVVLCILFHPYSAEATITNYIGDEAGFNVAISGLSTQPLIDFEDGRVSAGDPLTNQYADRNVLFSSPYGTENSVLVSTQ